MVSRPKEIAFHLLRWFSLLSLLSIGLVSVVSAFLLSRFLNRNMLERDAIVTMEFVQSIADAENTRSYFKPEESGKSKEGFEAFFKRIATMPEVVRANVYSRNGSVLWSDDGRLIGHRFDPNPQLETALSGKLAVTNGVSGKSSKPEHVFDEEVSLFAEIYIPIWDEGGKKVVGAVEVYKVPLSLFQAIKRGNRLVWLSAGLGGLFLYGSLFWIVRRASLLIRRQQEQLIESETMVAIGEMASAVAHGIRNPLASIRSSAEVALEENPVFRATATEIIQETDRIEDWIREMLASSKPPSGPLTPFGIHELIRSTLDACHRTIQKRGVRVGLDLEATSPLIYGDEALLRHVFISLINNALDAMPTGGTLTVADRMIASSNQIEIVIRDTGKGISQEQMDRLFKPFFTTKPRGMGIGLALAKRVIERHGGTLQLSSKEGDGTTVTLQLPISE